jgi:lactate dehydrogenase-like 2-hydroxyacid dehydrogenase
MNVAAFFPTSRPKVLVSFPVLKQVRAYIESRCEVMFNETGATLSPDELVRRAHGHNVLMITTTDWLDAHTLGRLPSEIRVIATYSVGHDHIDLPACQARGLTVINTPDVLTDAVAEVAMFLMIGAARRGTESIALLRSRHWPGWSPIQLPGMQLTGKRLGIFGMGRIGRALAHRAQAMGMSIHYANTRRLGPELEAGATYHHGITELLRASQFLALTCPSTPQTRQFLNEERLKLLPPGSILVNVARGDVVEDEALIAALVSGHVAAAGLDVFAQEPHLHPRYFELPNVFMTPHIGSSTVEARIAMAVALLDALDELAQGLNPLNRLV